MPRKRVNLSEYRSVWLFAMFDLPVDTRAARRNYTRFRKDLLREGFHMLQFSVYARFCGCEERAHVIRTRVHAVLPPDGQVRFVMITDRQFGKMEVYEGKTRAETEKPPPQLSFF